MTDRPQENTDPPTHPHGPQVAIIIPTHNRAALIPDAINSVLAQVGVEHLEIAIVDDGSTDNTQAVLKPYLDASPHIVDGRRIDIYYRKLDKQGVVAARNTAIAMTTAQWIAFLDSDDYWHEQKLIDQLNAAAEDSRIVLVHTSFRYVDEQGVLADDGPQRIDNPCVGDCLDTLLNEFLVIFSSVMVRRQTIEQAAAAEAHGQPFDPRWTNSQDYDLVLRCARLGRFAYVNQPRTFYRLHGAHGAMGNLKRAFGFHSRVQIDFLKRHGDAVGIAVDEGPRRARAFLFSRAEAAFWKRDLKTARDLCELARELGLHDPDFAALEARARRPAWLYRIKDVIDQKLGRGQRTAATGP